MKRKDKFTKDEIIDAFKDYPDTCDNHVCRKYESCSECIADWLEQEVEIKPRIATINTVDELNTAKKEYKDYCRTDHSLFRRRCRRYMAHDKL